MLSSDQLFHNACNQFKMAKKTMQTEEKNNETKKGRNVRRNCL